MPASAEQLEVRLIRASHELKTTDDDLKPLLPTLKKLFGYEHYTRLGNHHQQKFPPAQRRRLDLGEGFTIFITVTNSDPRGADVEFEWYSGKAALVKSNVRLTPNSPLLVRGPEVGKDWIILALQLHR
ncbi:MAG: hypothetical protein RMM51_03925 [Verrucomicrobiae bacterium]|nr:hypothetical protein [Verrucomicrobiae bacterium]